MGRDTFMISKNGTAIGVGSKIKADLYREANAWCVNQGLVMVPVSEKSVDGVAGTSLASAEIVFRAVKKGDYEDQRTNLRRVPDTVIEVINQPVQSNRPAIRNQRGEPVDEHGYTAATYEGVAKTYRAEGNKEMEEMALKKASALRSLQ